jgi:hypothetical protein
MHLIHQRNGETIGGPYEVELEEPRRWHVIGTEKAALAAQRIPVRVGDRLVSTDGTIRMRVMPGQRTVRAGHLIPLASDYPQRGRPQ